MAPKSSDKDWKSGEQLEFLLSQESSFKRCQDGKTLGQFWPRVFDVWYSRWPIPTPTTFTREEGSAEGARLMSQKDKNLQIKTWFNNRGRGGDSKTGRGDLKLDVNEKRKLAPVQAYCSYAWETLRPIVLTRWEQEKKSNTFEDSDDPPALGDSPTAEAYIPLAFKIKIARELYDQLSVKEKKDIEIRRDEERKKLYRKIPQIPDEGERTAKLRIHERNQPFVAKSVDRILANLEDQAGCIAHVLIASVKPGGGAPKVQKFCQGRTEGGDVDFETFYGDDWNENVETKFSEWALRVFGEKDSERRSMYLLPNSPTTSSQASTSGASPSTEPASEASSPTQTTPPQDSSVPSSSSQNSTSRPVASQKSTSSRKSTSRPAPSKSSWKSSSQSSASSELSSRPPVPRAPLPAGNFTPQVADASDLPLVNPLPPAEAPNIGDDVALIATALGVHQLLSQAVKAPTPVTTSESPDGVDPFQLAVNLPQHLIDPSQVAAEPSQFAAESLQPTIEPSEPAPESSQAVTEVVSMDTRPDSVVIPIPPQSLAEVPTASYRVKNSANVPSGTRSRRGSIEGAPGVVFDLHANSEMQNSINNDEPEMTIDLRDYISMDGDSEAETHVSSSQKSADGCRELSSPPPDPRQQRSDVEGAEEAIDQPQSVPARAYPQVDVDEEDLPAWMLKRGQWKYIVSTPGGPAWEILLKLYIQQERRLEFTETGVSLTNEGRPSKVKEYFQYAHQPSRGNTVTVPDFGAEVAMWWRTIQPEWRRSGQNPPQGPTEWSYILSGGSKGLFLVIMCLAWWDRAHARYLEEEKDARKIEARAGGVPPNFDNLPDHDPEWSRIVDDVAFALGKAQACSIPGRGVSTPSRRAKRQRETEPTPSRKKSKVNTAPLKTRSRT